MPQRIANMDRVGYTVDDGKGGRLFRTASRGDVIELDDAEAARLDAIDGAVVGADEDVDLGPGAYEPDLAQVAQVAGIGRPVDLHDNARSDLLARFGADLGSTEPPGGAMSGAGDPTLARTTATAGGPVSDEELAGMNATETLAYLNQHPDEVDRVEAANDAKAKPSKQVTDAVAAVRSAQDEQPTGDADPSSTE